MERSILALTVFGLLCGCTVESGPGDEGGGEVADAAPAPPPDAAKPIGDVENYCNDWVEIICRQLFTCLTQEERDNIGVPPTEAECVASEGEGCATASSADVCQEGVFQPDQAQPCVEQFGALTCEQFLDPDTDAVLAANAPACVAMCQ